MCVASPPVEFLAHLAAELGVHTAPVPSDALAVAALAQVGEPARERIAQAVIAKVSTYQEEGKVRIPGLARCIVGTK